MGRILANARVENVLDKVSLQFTGLVDSGSSHVVLPAAWRDRLGELQELDRVTLDLADQSSVVGTVCGPALITLEGFRPVFSEVVFVDMKPGPRGYEALIGYLVLESIPAAIDFLGHRLLPVKALDLK